MKPVIRRIPIKKKRAKPLAEVHKAELHKAAKSAAKTVKLVKAFLIQKCSRKITELREALTVHGCDASALESKLELELAQLQLFKLISSSDMCSRMCSLLSVGDKHDINSENEMSAVTDTVLRQKRVLQWVQDTETAIVSAVAKNNDLRAEEQKRDAKQLKKSKGLLAERKVSLKERTTAVFLDSLDSAGDGDETTKKRNKKNDQVRLQKNLRNQQNRSANKQKKQPQPNNPRDPPQDLSVYMPVNRRSGRDQPFAASSSGGRVAGVKRKADRSALSSEPAAKAPKTVDSHQTMTAMHPVTLEKCVASGKDWKESGVHPSWAAKHLSKSAPVVISVNGAPQGKKITFD